MLTFKQRQNLYIYGPSSGSKIPEANIQAELYCRCKQAGVICILGYRLSGAEFDAMIYDKNKKEAIIVEVKSYRTDRPARTNTKQLKKYARFGYPIYIISRESSIDSLIIELQRKLKEIEDKRYSKN